MPKYKNLGDLLSIGIMFPACIAIGYGVGYLLDRSFATGTTFKLIFLLLGIAAGFVNLFKVVRRLDRDDDTIS